MKKANKKAVLSFFLFFSMSFCLTVLAQEQKDTKKDTADTTAAVQKEPEPYEYSRPAVDYNDNGKRDPFVSLVPEELEKDQKIKGLFDYEKGKLRGIVKTPDDSYALVTDDLGEGYVLREGYRVQGGYVTQVTDDELCFHIVKYGRSYSIVMRLESSKATVVEETPGESQIRKPGINLSYKKTGAGVDKFTVEDVNVNSLEIKTVDETWFGKDENTPGEDISGKKSKVEKKASFVLLSPHENSWIEMPYVFDWTPLPGESLLYKLIISDDNTFEKPIIIKDGIKFSSFLLDEKETLPVNTKLYWKVIAYDRAGNETTCLKGGLSFKIVGKDKLE